MKPQAETLVRLSELLRRRPLTARQIAKEMGCCKPAAYARVRALAKVQMVERTQVRVAASGPKATAYWIRAR